MFNTKVSWKEREKRRAIQQRSAGEGQPFSITMCGWSSVSAPAHKLVTSAFMRALAGDSKLPQSIRNIEGMSGQSYRSFINNLMQDHQEARYLEVGSWCGSTATAALYGNAAKCVCIDNWSQFGGSRQTFLSNMELVRSETIDFSFVEQDFRRVDFRALGIFNVFMFDGPHKESDQYDGVMLAQPALDSSYILVVDDWNWEEVREGTLRALVDTKCRIEAWIEVRTTFDDTHPLIARGRSEWHNGYFIAALTKGQ